MAVEADRALLDCGAAKLDTRSPPTRRNVMSFLDKLLGRLKGDSSESHESTAPSAEAHAADPMPAASATAGSAMGEPPRAPETAYPPGETMPEDEPGGQQPGGPI
jgi:hypothetical protein